MVLETLTHLGVCGKGDEMRRGFLGKSMKRKKVQILFAYL